MHHTTTSGRAHGGKLVDGWLPATEAEAGVLQQAGSLPQDLGLAGQLLSLAAQACQALRVRWDASPDHLTALSPWEVRPRSASLLGSLFPYPSRLLLPSLLSETRCGGLRLHLTHCLAGEPTVAVHIAARLLSDLIVCGVHLELTQSPGYLSGG